jgi:DNA-binding transcriptional ArsR family regulator
MMMRAEDLTGDGLVRVLAALANPHRLRIVGALRRERHYVSNLARELDISRPLLQVHLRRLAAVGLVDASLEVSPDGKAMKFYELTAFAIELTPDTLAEAARTVTVEPSAHDED